MKKIIPVLFAGAIYSCLFANMATAQGSVNSAYQASKDGAAIDVTNFDDPARADKNTLSALKGNIKAAKANIRVNNHLGKNFKNVSDLKWNVEDKVIIASFKMDNKTARVVYDKRGNWCHSVINFNEDQMPGNIRALINSLYGGFIITLVQEVNQEDVVLYKVHLEDCNTIRQILICNNEITDYKNMRKGF